MRYAVVAGSAAAFGALALVARTGHSGKSGATASTATVSQPSDVATDGDSFDDKSQSFDLGSSSIAPSSSNVPSVQSSGS
jgi:hypothetical protein